MIKWRMARSTTYLLCLLSVPAAALGSARLPNSNLYTVYYFAIKLTSNVNAASHIIHTKEHTSSGFVSVQQILIITSSKWGNLT